MPKVHFGKNGGAYIMRSGKKRYLSKFGGSNEDFFTEWFNDERADLLRRGPPGVRTDYALASMPINENEIRGPGEPSAYELNQQKYYAENQVKQYESSMKAIFNKALRTFNRNSARATPEQIRLGNIFNSTGWDYHLQTPINVPATHRFRGGPRSWASITIGTHADQLRIFRNAYNYIRETTRVLAAMDAGLQFGKGKARFGNKTRFGNSSQVYESPEELVEMLQGQLVKHRNQLIEYKKRLENCSLDNRGLLSDYQRCLHSMLECKKQQDSIISLSRQSTLSPVSFAGEFSPIVRKPMGRYGGGADPKYLRN